MSWVGTLCANARYRAFLFDIKLEVKIKFGFFVLSCYNRQRSVPQLLREFNDNIVLSKLDEKHFSKFFCFFSNYRNENK